VHRPDLGRQEAAQQLVLALGAGLESREALADAKFDSTVVAELEVEAVEIAACAQ
jgi:hypothetical protein